AVPALVAEGVGAIVGLVLAPHYSVLSVGEYHQRAAAALERAAPGTPYLPVRSWHLAPTFLDALASRVRDTLARLEPRDREAALVVFSAHSLPARTRAMGDPYPDQVPETGAAVAARVGLAHWATAWQSASATGEPWLGPDLLEVIAHARADGHPAVVSCPCGFTADHLEILYDIDIEAQAAARRLDVRLLRTPSPNADPDFCEALADVAEQAAAAAG
ncbi:MAG TPA: ferrochelatase, partial [Candidatus Dormibacteraeota bacterium]|nr:ferrochelatase [Candidatus Dormibacteraeota bacterium]